MLKTLFDWILSFFKSKSPSKPQGDYDLFYPEELQIYRYFNGKEIISVDPMVLHRKVFSKGEDLRVDWMVARSSSNDAAKSYLNYVLKIRDIFNVKSLEEGGLDEVSTVDLLDHFLEFCEIKKKASNPTPIQPTETSQPTPISSGVTKEESQPIPNSSPTGSVEKEFGSVKQEQLPLVPEQPSETSLPV